MSNHTTFHKRTYASGATRWRCPTCDREIIISAGGVRVIALTEGDEDVIHQSARGDNIESQALFDDVKKFLDEERNNDKDT